MLNAVLNFVRLPSVRRVLAPPVLAWLVSCAPARAGETSLPPVFTSVDQVRRLPMEEAGKGYPVRLRGVLSYRAQGRSLFFLQDATGGIYVQPGGLPAELRNLRPGAELEIEGVTAAGRFAPFVEGRGGRFLGLVPLPEPAWVSPDQLSDPRHHSQWIEISGVARSVRVTPAEDETDHEAVITLGANAGRFTAVVYGSSALQPALTNLVGAMVRARGVYGSIFNERRQLVGMRLFVTSAQDLTVDQWAGPDPFASAPRAVASLMQFEAGSDTPSRVAVQGVVTLVTEDGLYLEDVSAGVKVQPVAPGRISVGAMVVAAGFPAWGDWSPVLEDAEIRVNGREILPPPPQITAAQALAGEFNFRRVCLEALLIEVPRHAQPSSLVLQSGNDVFLAHFTRDPAFIPTPLREGSWVRLAGVCINQSRPDPAAKEPSADNLRVRRAGRFHLLLGSGDDLTVLRAPSWWTASRLAALLALLGIILLAAAAWGVLLHRQVRAKTEIIRRQLARETVHEERERIARELHDTLEQEMTGIAMHLDAAAARLPASSDTSRQSIETARALLDRSRVEARRSIWELRSTTLEQGGLVAAFEELARSNQRQGGVAISLAIAGDARRLPAKVETHLLRIGHEALTNALKHSGAPRVDIHLGFTPDALTLRVRDDGCGFDAAGIAGKDRARFGLLGMRERATKIHARLDLASQPGQGTVVAVSLPLGNLAS